MIELGRKGQPEQQTYAEKKKKRNAGIWKDTAVRIIFREEHQAAITAFFCFSSTRLYVHTAAPLVQTRGPMFTRIFLEYHHTELTSPFLNGLFPALGHFLSHAPMKCSHGSMKSHAPMTYATSHGPFKILRLR